MFARTLRSTSRCSTIAAARGRGFLLRCSARPSRLSCGLHHSASHPHSPASSMAWTRVVNARAFTEICDGSTFDCQVHGARRRRSPIRSRGAEPADRRARRARSSPPHPSASFRSSRSSRATSGSARPCRFRWADVDAANLRLRLPRSTTKRDRAPPGLPARLALWRRSRRPVRSRIRSLPGRRMKVFHSGHHRPSAYQAMTRARRNAKVPHYHPQSQLRHHEDYAPACGKSALGCSGAVWRDHAGRRACRPLTRCRARVRART